MSTATNALSILIIDDNEAIHADFRKILCPAENKVSNLDQELFGTKRPSSPIFVVDSAFQGEEGFEKVEQNLALGNPYSVAFVDVRMPPGWDGVETAEAILKTDPNVQIVICTAYSDYATEDILHHFGLTDRVVVLRKPFENEEVTMLCVSLTQKWKLLQERERVFRSQTKAIQRASRMMNEINVTNSKLVEQNRELAVDSEQMANALKTQTIELMATQDIALFAMATMVECRDIETGEHLKRMQVYSQLIAEQLNTEGPYQDQVDDEFLRDLHRSTPLHDIGKVAIPDGILLKPGMLTEPEFETMKQHTTIGHATLVRAAVRSPYGSFLNMAADIALHHHERWDGKGYPDSLTGDEIPLAARIVAVGDAFDAISSNRVYAKSKSVETARAIIVNDSGSHFDPAVVDAFCRAYPTIVEEKFRIDASDKASDTASDKTSGEEQ